MREIKFMSANPDDDIIKLIIEADNLAAPELAETSRQILALGDDAQKAAKDLDELRIKDNVIKSFVETRNELEAMRNELAGAEVAFQNLKKEVKENTNATDEQRKSVVIANQELKSQRQEVRSQETSYNRLNQELRKLGITTGDVENVQQSLVTEIRDSQAALNNLTNSYQSQSSALRDQITVENALAEANRVREQRQRDLVSIQENAIAAAQRQAAEDAALRAETQRVTTAMAQYEVSLKDLHLQREANTLSAADLIRREAALREQLDLTASQVSVSTRALRTESEERVRAANLAAQQTAAEEANRLERIRVSDAMQQYETQLRQLNAQREADSITVADAIRRENELRRTLNLTESQISATRRALNAESDARRRATAQAQAQAAADAAALVEQQRIETNTAEYERALRELHAQQQRGEISAADLTRAERALRAELALTEAQIRATRDALDAANASAGSSNASTDLLTKTTRRLAQAYTVLIAAQGAASAVTTSVKNYGELQSAMSKVEKTTGDTAQQIIVLADEMMKLGEDITPTTTNELLRMSEVAGQLGIKGTGNLLNMVAAADALGLSTNLAGDEAATLLTRILGMTGEGVGEINGLSSSVVALGNNFAVAEDEIVHMTREIVTGTTSINLGSAAAAAYAATLKETGQTAERSRTALFKLSQSLKSAVANGGDELERLEKYTGQTAAEIEKNLGEKPELVLTALINGFGKARSEGENLSGVLNAMGITGSEAASVIEALAKNSGRLNDALALSNKSFLEQNAHFIEASKSYSTQEAALGKLLNKFTNLTARIGETYSDDVEQAIQDTSTLFDEQGESVIELMNLLGDLRGAIGDIGDTFVNLGNTLGLSGESFSALDAAIVFTRTLFNDLTIGINSTILAVQTLVYSWAQLIKFFDDSSISDKWLTDYEASMRKTAASIREDIQDISDAQADFDKTSSSSYRDLTAALSKYSTEISRLSEEEQARIAIIQEANGYVDGQNNNYRELTARLVSLSRETDTLNKLEARRVEASKAEAKVSSDKLIAARAENEALVSLSIATNEYSITSEQAKIRAEELTKAFHDGVIDREFFDNSLKLINVSVKENSIAVKENVDTMVAAKDTVAEYAQSNVDLINAYQNGTISAYELEQGQASLLEGYNAAQLELNNVAQATQFVSREMTLLDKQIDKTTNDIAKLESGMAAAGKGSIELATLTAKLADEQALLNDLTAKRNQLAEQEALTYPQLLALQTQYQEQLDRLNVQWKAGTITKAEYIAKSGQLNVALGEMNSILDSNTATVSKNTVAVSKNKDAQVEQTTVKKEATSASSLELDAQNKLTQAFDFTSSSLEQLSARYRELQTYIGQNNKVQSAWLKNAADTYNAGFLREQQIIEQTKKQREWTASIEAGSFSLEKMNGILNNTNLYFSELSGQQLDPLLAAIDEARGKIAELNGEVLGSLQDSQDRLDAALGNYNAITKREQERELDAVRELLAEAKAGGNQSTIQQAQEALSLLIRAQNAENKAADNGIIAKSSNVTQYGNGTGSNSVGTNTKHTVELKSPTGNTYSVDTASEQSAQVLLSMINDVANISTQQ